jgi:hypothetical protein
MPAAVGDFMAAVDDSLALGDFASAMLLGVVLADIP